MNAPRAASETFSKVNEQTNVGVYESQAQRRHHILDLKILKGHITKFKK